MNDSRLTLLVGSNEFWSFLERDLRQAQEQIFVQTLSFEGDKVGQRLADHLVAFIIEGF